MLRHQVDQAHGFVTARATHMHVLSEHRELLGEIAELFPQHLVAFAFEDAAIAPHLEGMRAATRDAHIEQIGLFDHHVAQRHEICKQCVVPFVDAGVELDHALCDLGLDLAFARQLRELLEKILRGRGQVVVAGVQALKLELDAERERFRCGKEQWRHEADFLLSDQASSTA